MKTNLYIPVYSFTLLLSATLLFSVQPMFSKMVLPLLGGTPQVWNTAMLFFQVMLLGGYAYAHGTTKFLSIRAQAILHIVLLLVFTIVLPFAIPEGWAPPVEKDPTLWQLSLMSITVGGPFFILAGSAPMLQRWFAATDHKDANNPYFLYGASNLGSMSALLAYPVIIEPHMTLSGQSQSWAIGYFILIVSIVLSTLLVWPKAQKQTPAKTRRKAANDTGITWAMRFRWLILAFAPSSLMLGVTTFITTDIASVPLLWVLPLALYVGTFIIVFARKPIMRFETIMTIQGFLLIGLLVELLGFNHLNGILFNLHPAALVAFHLAVFFFSALACHTELANSRPPSSHLTEFYLYMSIGGALGGFFNAIIAPNIFVIPLEYTLVLILICFLRYSGDPKASFKNLIDVQKQAFREKGINSFLNLSTLSAAIIGFATLSSFAATNMAVHRVTAFIAVMLLSLLVEKRWSFAIIVSFVLLIFPAGYDWGTHFFKNTVYRDRNFFGVIKVVDTVTDVRILLHGTTNHGVQSLKEEYKLIPVAYYSKFSPIKDVFDHLDTKSGKRKVAVIGLGIGVTACFSRKGREFDFYEIDPAIADVAQNANLFTYLADCGSPYKIILGDGRLTMEKNPDDKYDVIVLDAFSSDNIPIHLLTLEAIEIYLKKLKPDGILTFHISNNFLDLEPVLAQAGKKLDIPAYAKYHNGDEIDETNVEIYPSHFVIMSPSQKNIAFFENRKWSKANFRNNVKLWTDQFSNIFSVLGNRTVFNRFKKTIAEKEKESAEILE